MTARRILATLFLLIPLAGLFAADEPKKVDEPKKPDEPKPKVVEPDLSGFKTIKTAIPADPKTFKNESTAKPTLPGFIGVEVVAGKTGLPVVGDIFPASPAFEAGLKTGDVIRKIGDNAVANVLQAKDHLRGLTVGEKLTIVVDREGKSTTLSITPKAVSKPMTSTATPPATRAVMGVMSGDIKKTGGVEITEVTTGGGAEKAGIKSGDIILSIDEKKIDETNGLRDLLATKKAGDLIKVAIKRGDKDLELRVTLQGDNAGSGRPGGAGNAGWDERLPNAWKRKDYKLAVIGVEYPDQKHAESVKDKDWEESLFSLGKYSDKSATGQKVFGSMADYYKEISYGTLKVEGKFAGWVEVSKKRQEYSTGSGTSNREKTSLLTEAMDKLLAKDKDALKDIDGVFFLYAGGRINGTTRGSLYWPHRATVTHNGKRWPYFIVQEGGDKMTDISVFCHEFGHMLGLPDLYARPEVPGMEGVGVWCAMANQLPNGRPQHFSAWSKEQLGWIKPTMIDPRVKQKLILSPIEDSNGECFKVPIKADGSEYLLLENRQKKGFDKELPAEGLLIWRVMPGNTTQKVFLEESHGVEGPAGPRSFPGAVPFPSPANDSFTPYTTPSSKSQTGGGYEVYITNVRRLPDGRVTFQIGYEFQ